MRYYISDLHYFHKNINDNMDKRGFASLAEMHRFMVGQWNKRVRQNDEVVILGDLSMGKGEETAEIVRQLNGRLFLVTGNHDGFLKDKRFDQTLFAWIKPYAEMHDAGRKVVLSHYPIMFYNGQHRLDSEGKPRTFMLYGHVHDTFEQQLVRQFQDSIREMEGRRIPCRMYNCFCMYSNYTPWSLDEWIAYHES